jgi:hypothetical protein
LRYLERSRLVLSSTLKFLDQNLRLSKTGFYLFSIVSIIAVPLATAWSSVGHQLLGEFLVGIVLTLAVYLIYLLLISLQNKSALSEKYQISLVIILVIGAVRGLIFYYLLDLFDFEQPTDLVQRVLNSMLTTLIWLGIANVIIEVNRRYQRRFRAILSQLLVVNLRNSGSAQAGFAVIAQDLTLLQTRLEESYSSVRESSEDSESMLTAATEIRGQIEVALKPLSKRLWLNSMYEFPQIKFSRLFGDAIWNLKYSFKPILLIFTVSALVNLSPASGVTWSIVTGISGFVAFTLLESMRRLAIKALINHRALINFVFVLAVGLVSGMFSAIVLRIYNGEGSYYLAFLFSPYLSALVLASSAITLALSDRREILDNLSKGARRLTQSSNDSLQSSQAASYIHNSLQSELTAIAHEFELVAENPDKGKSRDVMEKLDALIRRSMGEDFSNFLESPESRFDRVIQSWSGLIKLETTIDRKLFTDPARANLFVQLVEESLVNSVRKGQASEVFISAFFTGSRLEIEIIDNGKFESTTNPGLGSAWIERFAVGEWKFESTESGTRLLVEL